MRQVLVVKAIEQIVDAKVNAEFAVSSAELHVEHGIPRRRSLHEIRIDTVLTIRGKGAKFSEHPPLNTAECEGSTQGRHFRFGGEMDSASPGSWDVTLTDPLSDAICKVIVTSRDGPSSCNGLIVVLKPKAETANLELSAGAGAAPFSFARSTRKAPAASVKAVTTTRSFSEN